MDRRSRSTAWIDLSAALTRRESLAPAPQLALQAGLARGPALFGLRLEAAAGRAVEGVNGALSARSLMATVSLAPDRRLAPELDLGLGATWGLWTQRDELVQRRLLPVATVGGGLIVVPRPSLTLRLTPRLSRELARTTLQVGQGPDWPLSPWQLGVELGLRLEGR